MRQEIIDCVLTVNGLDFAKDFMLQNSQIYRLQNSQIYRLNEWIPLWKQVFRKDMSCPSLWLVTSVFDRQIYMTILAILYKLKTFQTILNGHSFLSKMTDNFTILSKAQIESNSKCFVFAKLCTHTILKFKKNVPAKLNLCTEYLIKSIVVVTNGLGSGIWLVELHLPQHFIKPRYCIVITKSE